MICRSGGGFVRNTAIHVNQLFYKHANSHLKLLSLLGGIRISDVSNVFLFKSWFFFLFLVLHLQSSKSLHPNLLPNVWIALKYNDLFSKCHFYTHYNNKSVINQLIRNINTWFIHLILRGEIWIWKFNSMEEP